MRSFRIALLFAALGGLVNAAASAMPDCATQCLKTSLEAQDRCAPTDIACICEDKALNGAIQTCVLQSCTIIEALAAQNATQTMCGAPVRDITHITPIIAGTSGAAGIIGVVVRVWTSGADFWIDDALCVIALLFAIPMAILEFLMSGLGFGKDIWTLTPDQIYRIIQFTWLTEIFWFFSIGCTKLAFLFFYLRVFPRQKLRRTIHVLIGVAALDTIIFTVIVTVNCLPVTYIWTAWDGLHSGSCINLNAFVWAHAGIDIAFDCIIFAVPIPELIKLNMSMKKRIMIIAMFSVGGLGTIISILRLQSLLAFSNSTNATWDNCPTAYWSVLSCFVGIFCACMPAFRKCLGLLFPSWFSTTKQNSGYSSTPSEGKDQSRFKSALGRGTKLQGLGGIRKTVDTDFTVTKVEDDEQELVDMKCGNDVRSPSRRSVDEGSDGSVHGHDQARTNSKV